MTPHHVTPGKEASLAEAWDTGRPCTAVKRPGRAVPSRMIRRLALLALVVSVLSSCGLEACTNSQFCIPVGIESEPEPTGRMLVSAAQADPSVIPGGQTRTVILVVDRTGLPAADPVYLRSTTKDAIDGDPTLFARTEGLVVRGSTKPFTTDTTTVSVAVPAGTPARPYEAVIGVRRVASKYASTLGTITIHVQVP